jgi:hypothetical protein
MTGVFNIAQIVDAKGLNDWKPNGGLNGADHNEEIGEVIEMSKDMGEELLAALQKHGPCSPADLAKHCDVERPEISKTVHRLLEAKKVKATGATASRMIALPGQVFAGAEPKSKTKAPPQPKPLKLKVGGDKLNPIESALALALRAAREARCGDRCD